MAGVCVEPDTFFPLVPLLKGLTVAFSIYYRTDEFRTVVEAFASGRIDPAPLITRTVGFDDLDATFDSLVTAPEDVKVIIDPRL